MIGIESVGGQKEFQEASEDYVMEQVDIRGDEWRPRVFPITYPSRESKAQRIAAMEWRYPAGRMKYPAHLKDEWPYNQLYAQTADFTMDLALLQHDDVIDTLSMNKYVIKGRGRKLWKERKGRESLLERIKRNKPIAKGLPLLSGVNIAEVTDEMLGILSRNASTPKMNPKQRRIERSRPRKRRIIIPGEKK